MCIPVLISVCVIKYNNGVLLNNPHGNQIDNGILAFSSTSTQNDIYRIHTKASLLADISSCKFRNKSIPCFISIFYARKMVSCTHSIYSIVQVVQVNNESV